MGSATVGAGVTSALNAGFSALVAQAAVQVAGNGGDIGAALQGLASSETVRLLATTMLTAGITSGITTGLENAATTAEQAVGETIGQAASETSAAFITELTDKLQNELIAAGVRTGVGTAINGGDLGENMIANLQGAAVHALGAQMANEIGAAYADGDLDYVTHKIAHAALGGAMDVAMGGDGTAGAIGGVVGEITAEAYLADRIKTGLTENDLDKLERVGVDFSKLAAGLVAAGAGADVNTAADTAENAAENNAVDTLFDALFVLADTGKIAWGYIVDDEGTIEEGIIDLTADSAALCIPFIPAGTTRVARIFKKVAVNGDELYETAKKGGRYSGCIKNFKNRSIKEIEKSIKGFEKQIRKHHEKMQNPEKYVSPEKWSNPSYRQGIIEKWQKDIKNNTERLEIMKRILHDKKP